MKRSGWRRAPALLRPPFSTSSTRTWQRQLVVLAERLGGVPLLGPLPRGSVEVAEVEQIDIGGHHLHAPAALGLQVEARS